MRKKYRVAYYDSFDNEWCEIQDFESLAKAIELRDIKNSNLEEGNIQCGEHYGVIDLTINREINYPLKVIYHIAKSEGRSDGFGCE